MEQTKFIEQFCKSRKNLLDMLEERGSDVSQYRNFSPAEIRIMIPQTQNNKVAIQSEPGPLDIIVTNRHGSRTYVKYRLDKIKAAKSLESYINKIYDSYLDQNDELIIIVPEKSYQSSSSFDTLLINFYNQKLYYVQVFGNNQLLYKVTEHELVPKHQLLTSEEKDQILEKYGLGDDGEKLGIISRNDPVAQYYGVRPGELVKITRNSIQSGKYQIYRCCK